MSFQSDTDSVENSQPREGIAIAFPLVTYRIATGDQTVTIGGFTYPAAPGARGEIQLGADANTITIVLPVQHPAVQRYMANGIPPQQSIAVAIYQQQTGGDYQEVWTGQWKGMSVARHLASLTCVMRVGFALSRRMPTITVGRECVHVLYDTGCRLDRASFNVATTVTGVDGLNVTVASMSAHPDQWAQFGELLHTASGERMTVGSHVGTTITMQCPIPELKVGDAVTIYAGCAHDVITCRDKFANVVNFGGMPGLVSFKPFSANGRGVWL